MFPTDEFCDFEFYLVQQLMFKCSFFKSYFSYLIFKFIDILKEGVGVKDHNSWALLIIGQAIAQIWYYHSAACCYCTNNCMMGWSGNMVITVHNLDIVKQYKSWASCFFTSVVLWCYFKVLLHYRRSEELLLVNFMIKPSLQAVILVNNITCKRALRKGLSIWRIGFSFASLHNM